MTGYRQEAYGNVDPGRVERPLAHGYNAPGTSGRSTSDCGRCTRSTRVGDPQRRLWGTSSRPASTADHLHHPGHGDCAASTASPPGRSSWRTLNVEAYRVEHRRLQRRAVAVPGPRVQHLRPATTEWPDDP